MKKTIIYFLLSFLCISILNATNVTFAAQSGTGVSNLFGTPLSDTLVELGYYDSIFNPLLATTTTGTGVALPPGLFGGSVLINSNPLTGFQPAIRIFSDDGGSVIAYSTDWLFSAGDGTGTDTNADLFDLSEAVSGGSLTSSGVVLASIGSQFDLNGAVNPTFSSPSLAIGLAPVPEPSTYALFAGVLAFGYIVIRRSRSQA